jgi:transglutaminase-like putative cysteine protease
MRFTIQHRTHYRYSAPVRLDTQQLRFHPRGDRGYRVLSHQLAISPLPTGRSEQLDAQGNLVTLVWFDRATEDFAIEMSLQLETGAGVIRPVLPLNASVLPLRMDNHEPLLPACIERNHPHQAIDHFAAELGRSVNSSTLDFLDCLNQTLFSEFAHIHRETGEPQNPEQTLQSRRGACRDLAVLFIDCCRAMGMAARFVSGYQRGDEQRERRHLHAWPEVYLPGAGWFGYDPAHGKPVHDSHVAIAAAARPGDTMPVIGAFSGNGVTSKLDFDLTIQVD